MDDDDENDSVQQQQLPQIPYKAVFAVAPAGRGAAADTDKIRLPPSALEALLAAAAQARRAEQRRQQQPQPFRSSAWYSDNSSGSGPGPSDVDLPQPLTFRLTNTATGQSVYAGIREFSADEGQVVVPGGYLRRALGLGLGLGLDDDEDDEQASLAVSFCALPKGTYVHLRPLAAGYNPTDWRPLLERQLREGYTTLTRGVEFQVRGNRGDDKPFRFRVDAFRPAGDGICVVDTDLEVDIEALDEEQARQTAEVVASSSSEGGTLDVWKPVAGHVRPGDYVDYELASWDRSRPVAITLSGMDDEGLAVDVFVSPRSARQRARPRATEHVWANWDAAAASDGTKTLVLLPTSADLAEAEALMIAVHGWGGEPLKPTEAADTEFSVAHPFTLRARIVLDDEMAAADGARPTAADDAAAHPDDDDARCPNCRQWVPARSMVLHETFCRRNNAACAQCGRVFQARSAAWREHWHCAVDPADGGRGDSAASRRKHDAIFHPDAAQKAAYCVCPAEACRTGKRPPFASVPALACHRTTTCPGKVILCQFCQLEVPQGIDESGGSGGSNDEGPAAAEAREAALLAMTGLTAHERADGARTTDCYLCGAIVRMRDMRAHLQHHALDRQRRARPAVCRDALCGRTLFGVGERGQIKTAGSSSNPLGLCAPCFAPLYVSTHDPDGRALRRRVERRYLAQLLAGCRKAWCANPWCKTGRQNTKREPLGGGGGTAALLPLVRPLVAEAFDQPESPLHFCVDEASQTRRTAAEALAATGAYALPWCVAASEATGGETAAAWQWLADWAPREGGDTGV